MAAKRAIRASKGTSASANPDTKKFSVELPLVSYGLLNDIAKEYTTGVGTVARMLLQYAIPRSPAAMGTPAATVLKRHGITPLANGGKRDAPPADETPEEG